MNKRLLSSLFLLFTILRSSDASSRIMMAQAGSPSPSPAFSPIPRESKIPPPPPKDKKDEKPGVSSGSTGPEKVPVEEEGCDASALATCHAEQNMVACIRHRKIDSKRMVLLVQNNGESNLSVVIKVPTTVEIGTQVVKLAKHDIKMVWINVSGDGTSNLKIVLNSGKDDCVLKIASSISGWNPLQQYSAHLTPTNGVYFLFATFTIAAGTWACCKLCRKGRRADAGVLYQQLEMGMQTQTQQSSTAPVEADGWDQGWDDDWDGEEGTVRPSSSPNGNGSSNGLTSRSANKKNGWDIDWDD